MHPSNSKPPSRLTDRRQVRYHRRGFVPRGFSRDNKLAWQVGLYPLKPGNPKYECPPSIATT
jgi:hypothetical protein